jgi:hypothetical protein
VIGLHGPGLRLLNGEEEYRLIMFTGGIGQDDRHIEKGN